MQGQAESILLVPDNDVVVTSRFNTTYCLLGNDGRRGRGHEWVKMSQEQTMAKGRYQQGCAIECFMASRNQRELTCYSRPSGRHVQF